jgi:hypothetical protein
VRWRINVERVLKKNTSRKSVVVAPSVGNFG